MPMQPCSLALLFSYIHISVIRLQEYNAAVYQIVSFIETYCQRIADHIHRYINRYRCLHLARSSLVHLV
jgi:hypothetical protein